MFKMKITRREFLKTTSLGSIVLAGGCLPQGKNLSRGRAPGRKVQFVFFSDVHTRTEWDTPQALKKAAEAINSLKPDLVIAGGDLITDGFQSFAETVAPRWEAYLKMHTAIDAPVYPVLGNHDLVAAIPEDGTEPSDDPRKIFCDTFALKQTYRSFDCEGYHFILLDSIQITGDKIKYRGMIPDEQLEWLKDDISQLSSDTPVILVTHIPLLTAFYMRTGGSPAPVPENRVIVNSLEVLGLFQEKNLLLVLQGHLHVEEELKIFGTTFITGGAVCGKWWRGPWFGTEEGIGLVTLAGNTVGWRYIDYGWQARRPADQ